MLCLALLIVGIDGTIVNVALPSFVRELNASPSQLQWISDAYTLVLRELPSYRRAASATGSGGAARCSSGSSCSGSARSAARWSVRPAR